MYKNSISQVPCRNINHNLSTEIKTALTNSSHEWQYCFLERGGDSGEVYLSAKQILEFSESVARQLVVRTPPNSHVLLSIEHGPDFLICFLACVFAQRTVVPVPLPRFSSQSKRFGSIAVLIENSFIVARKQNFECIQQALLEENLCATGRMLSLEELKSGTQAHAHLELPGFSTAPQTPIVIQFTSGSTSTPKGVLISSENILANQKQVSTRWDFQKQKTLLTWLPYYHDMGLFGGLLYPLLDGMKVVQMDPIHFIQKPQRWIFAMSKFRAEISGGPAFSYGICNELDLNQRSEEIDLSNWQVAFCGADYVPSHTVKQFVENYSSYGLDPHALTPVYGLAEATLFVAGQRNSKRPAPVEYSENLTMGCYLGESDQPNAFIYDINKNTILPEGQIGEICFAGTSVTQGYYKTDSTSDRILRTGDTGFIKDNYLFICGRLKDIIVSHGQNISPGTIEQIATDRSVQLNPHAAAAFQLYQPREKTVLLIEVIKSANGRVNNSDDLRSDIIAQIQQRVGISLTDVIFLKRGELMKTSSGKVQRLMVAEKFRLGHTFREADNADH